MDNLNLCLTILITGFVVVFAVLILLIIIIKIYGTIVSGALRLSQDRKKKEQVHVDKQSNLDPVDKSNFRPSLCNKDVSGGVDPEVVAVIAAAVESSCGAGASARITSIKKSKTPSFRPIWSMAGIIENTRPF